jgi:hypothetical protein
METLIERKPYMRQNVPEKQIQFYNNESFRNLEDDPANSQNLSKIDFLVRG